MGLVVSEFVYTFQDYYDYDEICTELENLQKLAGESDIDFHIRFKLITFKFHVDDKPSDEDLTQWFIHLCSLPCIHNDFNEPENFSFLSVHTTIDVTNYSFEPIDDVNKHVLINSSEDVDN
jgi:hypothetical protein